MPSVAQQLAIALGSWVINPFHMILLLACCHELRAVSYSVGERHLIGHNERGLDLMTWFATSLCAFCAMWFHLGGFFNVSSVFGILVLLQGVVLLERWREDKFVVVHTRVYIAEKFVYALVILWAGTISFAF